MSLDVALIETLMDGLDGAWPISAALTSDNFEAQKITI